MKKILLLLTCITGLLHSVPYSQLRSDLKKQLSQGHAQFKVISHDDYISFIEKYIIQAEQDLAIIREVSKMTDISDYQASSLERYFYYLGKTHSWVFDNLIKSNRTAQSQIELHSYWLNENIDKIKEEFNLDIDAEVELKNTLNLLHKVNRNFIKHIGQIKYTHMRIVKQFKHVNKCMLRVILFPFCWCIPWVIFGN